MSIALVAKKIGMTTLFDEKGIAHPVTLLSHQDAQHVVSHRDGAIQISAGPVKKKPNKPTKGHFAKANVEPKRKLYECKVDDVASYELGSEITLEQVADWEYVDVSAMSKGKGFSGAMKAHNFAGQRASHGVSISHRKVGSIGQCQDPGRVFPGKKMAKRLGGVKKTIQSLKVIEIDQENKVIVVKGSVPGPKGSYVHVKKALKKNRSKS